MDQPLVLTVGDLVVYKKQINSTGWTDGDLHIIKSVRASSEGIQYTTHRGAWFRRTDFDLVEASSAELMDILFSFIPEDVEEDVEESDGTYVFHARWRDPVLRLKKTSKYDL